MKKRFVLVAGMCLLLGACSNNDPELLDPVGEQLDSATVIRGEMYNIESYESAVTSNIDSIKLTSDGVIKKVNVQLGDKVKAGDVLVTLDGDSVSGQVNSIDDEIAQKEKDNEYLNELAEYDIQIAELELQKVKQTSQSTKDVSEKTGVLQKLKDELYEAKVKQQQEIAQLQLDKLAGGTSGGELAALRDGTVVYLDTGEAGATITAGTVVVLIAQEDSLILHGDYIDVNEVEEAHRIYAVIGDKEYNITNVPYDPLELANRTFYKLPLYSTFYVEEAPEVQLGMYAAVVVISDYLEDALQIPDNALLTDIDGYYVYKIEGDEYIRQDVKIGHITDTAVEITEGLEEGDEVYVKP